MCALTVLSLLGLSYHEVEEGEVLFETEAQEHPAGQQRVRPCKENQGQK